MLILVLELHRTQTDSFLNKIVINIDENDFNKYIDQYVTDITSDPDLFDTPLPVPFLQYIRPSTGLVCTV